MPEAGWALRRPTTIFNSTFTPYPVCDEMKFFFWARTPFQSLSIFRTPAFQRERGIFQPFPFRASSRALTRMKIRENGAAWPGQLSVQSLTYPSAERATQTTCNFKGGPQALSSWLESPCTPFVLFSLGLSSPCSSLCDGSETSSSGEMRVASFGSALSQI